MSNNYKIIILIVLMVFGIFIFTEGFDTKLDRIIFSIYWGLVMIAIFHLDLVRTLVVFTSLILIVIAIVLFLFETDLGGLAYYIQRSSTWSFGFLLGYFVLETIRIYRKYD